MRALEGSDDESTTGDTTNDSADDATDLTGLESPVDWDIDYPSWKADEVLPGLFMGGTHDNATVADAMWLGGLGGTREYEAVVTLYAWAQPMSWEVEELRYGFGDGAIEGADLARVLRAARWAHERWQSGDRVLIRCQAGLNRSGLVTALVMMLAGWDPAAAIWHLRLKRSPHVLFNHHFVRWLMQDGSGALAAGAHEGPAAGPGPGPAA